VGLLFTRPLHIMTTVQHTELFAKVTKPLRPRDEEDNELNETEDNNDVDHDVTVVTSHCWSTILYAAHTDRQHQSQYHNHNVYHYQQ